MTATSADGCCGGWVVEVVSGRAEGAAWRANATGAAVQIFTYPGAGHFCTDADSPDFDERAAALTWQRVLAFHDALAH